jgi:retron-type reverse transcriptase
MAEGVFPDSLKVAKVSPIYKSGTKLDPGNYRPVSVLPVLSKILEKLIYKRLNDYLTEINFLCDQQYGFRSKSNTLSAAIDLVTKIKNKIDQRQLALGVFIDLKKAFDTVSHSLLLKKLESIGVTDVALQMFRSYLKNRRQIVKFGNYQSSTHPITCGVPQGSILR